MPNCNFRNVLIDNWQKSAGEIKWTQARCVPLSYRAGGHMLTLKKSASIVAFLGLTLSCAQAADIGGDSPLSYKDAPGNYWVVTLGGYGGAEPLFPGSKTETLAFIPVIDIHRAGEREWLMLPTDAFGYTLYQTGNFRIGASGDYILDRNHKDDSALRGLSDINYTLELGAFAEYYPAPFIRTRIELLQGVSGADGLAANLKADYIFQPNAQWLFTVGPRLQFVNTQYESTFFSINSVEMTRSGLPAYHASGGLNSAGLDATARYNVNEHLSLRAFADWERLVGDAVNSPIVKQRGSEDQFEFGVGAAYRFTYGR
jgi:MipA family protein